MGISERRAREKDELRRKILEAAAGLFVQDGYASVSMRKIADRIEYAPSTIYLYFKEKKEIVDSICVEAFDELKRRLQEILDLGLPPLEALRRSLRAYIQFGLDHPNHYIFLFCTPKSALSEPRSLPSNRDIGTGMESFDRLRKGLLLCMQSGGIAHNDLEPTAQSVWLMLHGITAGLIVSTSFPFVDREMLIQHGLDILIRGLQ